jgi:hypothetical protein
MNTSTHTTGQKPQVPLDDKNQALRQLASVSMICEAESRPAMEEAIALAQFTGVTTSQYLMARLLLKARIVPDYSEDGA